MCGIVGLYSARGVADDATPLVRNMLSLIRHRGPDEFGYYVDDRAAFGTARLSILDLAGGQQPIGDEDERFWIAYNGEVYNYIELREELEAAGFRFRTRCDTEVVLNAWRAWGADAFPRLNGAFAFAIYDSRDHNLTLVRDRYGKRPLFYTDVGGQFLFASEMKCFLAHPGVQFSFDRDQLASAFYNWTPLPEETGYRGIRQLPMASWMQIDADGRSIHEYAPLELNAPAFTGTQAEAIERTRELLSDSVKLRLRSDVEVGTYLSGGVDSAIVTQLALENHPAGVNSFSVTFEEESYDESSEQQELSRALGTRHHTVHCRNRDLAEWFPAALWHAEVPVFRSAFVPLFALSRLVREHGIKVVLTGEGADESFFGYNIFKEILLRSRWNELNETERQDALGRLYPYMSVFDGNARAMAGMYQRFSNDPNDDLFAYQLRHNMSGFSLKLLADSPDLPKTLDRLVESQAPGFHGLSGVKKGQWLEFKTLLSGYLLSTQGDRMSMGNGVENRCPFLDYRVVEWAASLPVEWHLQNSVREKHMLREAFADKLPAFVLDRAKQPYRAPDLMSFLHADKPDYLDAVLSEAELRQVDVFNVPFCLKFLNKIFRGPAESVSPRESQAFMFLLSTALLHRQFVRRGHDHATGTETRFHTTIDRRKAA